jgi:hypothetical protein
MYRIRRVRGEMEIHRAFILGPEARIEKIFDLGWHKEATRAEINAAHLITRKT